MDDFRNTTAFNYRIQNKSSSMILFIGFSFMIIAFLNFIIEIPVEYLVGVSFAAFFFVVTDFMQVKGSERNPPNEKVYSFILCLAVMSFILIPLILPSFPDLFKLMSDYSESVTIFSLGLVLTTMYLKLNGAKKEFFGELTALVDKNQEAAEKNQEIADNFQIYASELVENREKMLEKVDETLDSSFSISKKLLSKNHELIKLIEDGESLEEIKEEIKKHK